MKNKTGFWENFILIAIILVICQTFIEEMAVLDNWSVKIRQILILTGLFFDTLFTLEYLIRQIVAIKRKQGLKYLLRERGWIDLFSSVPLLLLNSGPQALLLLHGGDHMALQIGSLNLMKIVKTVRVTRILRFIRTIKLFGKIHNADSHMAQRHIARISSMTVVLIIVALMGTSFIGSDFSREKVISEKKIEYSKIVQTARQLSAGDSERFTTLLGKLLKTRNDFLVYYAKSGQRIGTISDSYFQHYFTGDDYIVPLKILDIRVSMKEQNRDESWRNLVFFVIIIMLVLAYMLFYTKHFVQSVSDVVHVMVRGMSEANYNLQVKINDHYADDEIFTLAQLYNEKWLPAKDKHDLLGEEPPVNQPQLSLDEFFGRNDS